MYYVCIVEKYHRPKTVISRHYKKHCAVREKERLLKKNPYEWYAVFEWDKYKYYGLVA